MLVPHSEFVAAEESQQMEETANAVDDPPSAERFTWTIENFSTFTNKKLYFDVFVAGGYRWRVRMFPKGNDVDHLSMYLDVVDSTALPHGWSRTAQFSLAVVNQIHSKFTIKKFAPTEAANAIARTPARFTWTIENFSKLTGKKFLSDVFVVGGYKWRVRMFLKGNDVDHLSMYLDVADSTALPHGWSRTAQLSLAVVNQIHRKFTIKKYTIHRFNARESDWGFTSFMPLSELYDPSRGYLLGDTFIVKAEVAVHKVVDYWSHDSKKETGYVGLINQVVPAEAANAIDPTLARFTWTIENFSKLTGKKLCFDVFIVGGYKWRVCMFPEGNGVDHLSLYLDVADSITLPFGWNRYAQFSLEMVNQIHRKFTIRKVTQHEFNARESDWGFTTFMPLSDLYDPSKGYLILNDTCIVEADVAVGKVVDVESSSG